ncbi:hypothetical protein SULI_00410 [Saccharolobus solfataricus]|nr:hypothetical protein [Saccharolobus solfataricus]AKA72534.1 hypothetical protein SULB_0082 [Saccharolobus solfataricus]AKA75233.1 hypothetical protein SULC_0081 [Saccharolobus solfataricus]AKA77926.1 hypothetical protein SULA_0081 [Saccharolobus solfataricus]AZF67044.1 hypothetical protein SULG_00410 [Saccharolobus solfataricus]AZF69664.1 hypothetical protein SULH_00410 [Saccharolobus solfataricus]
MKNSEYYIWVLVGSIILTIILLSMAPLVPIDEPLVYRASSGVTYNLTIPVGVSFSAFIALIIFIISILLISTFKNDYYNMIIDTSAISFVFLNYLNYYLIWYVWRPQMQMLPFLIEIVYNHAATLQLDIGQIVIVIFLYRLYKRLRKPRSLSGPDEKL